MSIVIPLFLYFIATSAYAEDAPEDSIDLQGKWVFDIKASLDRCFRLNMHDCKGKDREVVEKNMQAYIDKKGIFSIVFQGTSVTIVFGDQIHKKTYTTVHKGFNYAMIGIVDEEDGSPENILFVKDAPNVICMGEDFPESDTICIRKTP